jgi:hypothetical protein
MLVTDRKPWCSSKDIARAGAAGCVAWKVTTPFRFSESRSVLIQDEGRARSLFVVWYIPVLIMKKI